MSLITKIFYKWRHRQRRFKHGLRNTYIHRLLGEKIFQRRIWSLNVNSLAGGLSLGLFIAFTPTIPFQMFLCAIGAILLRVNLPIALAACWITNPLTALPIYLTARQLGRTLLEHSWFIEVVKDLFQFEGRTGAFMEQSLYLWFGALIISMIAALSGYILVRIAWRICRWLKIKITVGDREEDEDEESIF